MGTIRRSPLLGVFGAMLAAAVLAAGCSGRNTAVLPSTPSAGTDAAASAPAVRHHGKANLKLRVPPSKRRRRHGRYISPNTKSLVIGVQYATGASPWPSLAPQTFVVATPQPCTGSPSAGYSCTFNLVTYAGKNVFTFNTYAVASPGPSDTPLSSFVSGVTTIGGSGSSSLNFALEGVVSSVVLGVPSPESSHAPTTQAIPIGVATSFPLSIDPMDASGASIATDTFSAPITITAGPANSGVTLALAKKCTGDVDSGAKVVLNCAADLAQVTVSYDGSITAAGSGPAVVDTSTISASPAPSSAPSPAIVALGSNVLSYQILPSTSYGAVIYKTKLDPVTGHLIAAAQYNGGFELVDFNPTAKTATSNAVTQGPTNLTVDPNGDIWTNDLSSAAIWCFAGSISATPVVVAISDANGQIGQGVTVASDAFGNIWFGGTDTSNYSAVGSIPNACSAGSGTGQTIFGAQFSSSPLFAPSPTVGGNAAVWGSTGSSLYAISTTTGSSPAPVANYANSDYPNDVTSDASQNFWMAMYDVNGSYIAEAQSPADTVQSVAPMPPSSSLSQIATYNGSQAAAHAALASDSAYDSAVLVNPLTSTTEPLEVPIQMNQQALSWICPSVAFDKTGGAWDLCPSNDGSVWADRVVVTSTWMPITSYPLYCTSQTIVVGVPETANSSPFSITSSNPGVLSPGTPFQGNFPHSIPMQLNNSGASLLTISDAFGRTEKLTANVGNSGCSGPRPHDRGPKRKTARP